LGVKGFGVVDSAMRAVFAVRRCRRVGRRALERFSSRGFHFEIKTNAFSIAFGPGCIRGRGLKEIGFPARNAVDRF